MDIIINVPDEESLTKIFDCSSVLWTKDYAYNLTFIRMQERHCNDVLTSRGYIFLNEVYDMLGLPRTKIGQVAGWTRNAINNRVDFGIRKASSDDCNPDIELHFNCDLCILDKI